MSELVNSTTELERFLAEFEVQGVGAATAGGVTTASSTGATETSVTTESVDD